VKDDVQALIDRLGSLDPSDAAAAAEALCHLGRDAQAATVALVRAAGAGDETVRAWVAAALEEVGPPAAGQIGELIRLADHQESAVRFWAVTLLGRAGAAAAQAIDAIAAQLRHSPDLSTRERAAWALGRIGPPAVTAVSALHMAAASGEPRLSRLAKASLASIAGE
jgi:HEAT repeat protein